MKLRTTRCAEASRDDPSLLHGALICDYLLPVPIGRRRDGTIH